MNTPFTRTTQRTLQIGVTIAIAASTGFAGQAEAHQATLAVAIDDRSSGAATEIGTARARAGDVFEAANVRIVWTAPGEESVISPTGDDAIRIVVVGGLRSGSVADWPDGVLAFALPAARRVYVHYDRVHALARQRATPPGWFLGIVIAHELTHVLLPEAPHTATGVMAAALAPDPTAPPIFTAREAHAIRSRLQREPSPARPANR